MFLICLTKLLLYTLVRAQCEISKTAVNGDNHICKGKLVYSDEFDSFDLGFWSHENNLAGGGNGEFQWYTNNRSNSYVKNGILYIKPTLTADDIGESALTSKTLNLNSGKYIDYCTGSGDGCVRTGAPNSTLNPIKSARLTSINSFSFKYGQIKVRAKMPTGDWLWPAIWMMPRYSKYGGWPTSGEIDIVESRGNRELKSDGKNIGTQQMGSTLHWGPNPQNNGFMKTHWEKNNAAGYNNDFHEYEAEWTPEYIKFLVDGQQIGIVYPPGGGFWELGQFAKTGLNNPWKGGSKMAPFDQEFNLIINVAIGGTNGYFPDNANNPNGKPWSNSSPQRKAMTDFWNGRSNWLPTWKDNSALQVDYIRIYAL